MSKDPSKIVATTILQRNVIYRLLQPIQPSTLCPPPLFTQQVVVSPCVAWHTSNLIAFYAPIPHDVTQSVLSIPNTCDIFILSPQAPWDLMQVNIPEQASQVSDLLWTASAGLFLLCQSGDVCYGEMEQHAVNSWRWERVTGLCLREQLALLQMVELGSNESAEGALFALTQNGELTLSKKMGGLLSADLKMNLPTLSQHISAITDVTHFLESDWTTLRGRIDVTHGPPLTAAIGRSESLGLCLYSLTELGMLSVYRLVPSFSHSESDRSLLIEHIFSQSMATRGSCLKLLLADPLLPRDLIVCSENNSCLELSLLRLGTEGEQSSISSVSTKVPLPSLPPLLFYRSFHLVPSVSQRDTAPSLLFLPPSGDMYAVHSLTGELLLSRMLPRDSADSEKEQKTPGMKYQKLDSQSDWPVLAVSPNSCLCVLLDLSSLTIHIINLGLNTPPDSTLSGPSLMAQRFWHCLLADLSHWDLAVSAGIRGDKDILPLISELESRFQAESSEFREIHRPRFLALKATLLSTLIHSYQQVSTLHSQIRLLYTGQYLRTLLGPNSHSYPAESWPSHQLRRQLDSSQDTDLNAVIERFETKDFTGAGGMNVKNDLVFIVDQSLLALNEAIGPMASSISFPSHEPYIWRELRELLVLVGIWSKLYPRLSPFSAKPENQELLTQTFIAVSRVLHCLQASRELTPADILEGVQLPLNEPPIFSTSDAPQLQTLAWGLSAEELPQLYYQARSPSLSQNILPYLNILNPISLLLLEVPRQLSPPWIGEVPESQYDVINHTKLERKHWEEGLRQCTYCRRFTQCLDRPQGSEEVVLLRQSWKRFCFCGGLWRKVDLSNIDVLRFDRLFSN